MVPLNVPHRNTQHRLSAKQARFLRVTEPTVSCHVTPPRTEYVVRVPRTVAIETDYNKHEFEVAMTCEGCSGAVTRVLNKLGDVKFEIDLPKKLVWIESDKDVDVLMETLKKCGKEVKYNGTK
ncbi:hypothetical protein PAMA_017705 [Pampus argenteus]